jgi:hypothetical protein
MVLSIMGWLALADPGPHPAGKSSPFLSPVDTQIAFVKNSPLDYGGNVKNLFFNTCGNVKSD